MTWVVDASVALKWFIKDEQNDHADKILRRLLSHPGDFAVPELFAYEMFSVLTRMTNEPENIFLNGVLPIMNSGILRFPMTDELARKAMPYVKQGLTGYDAVYVALAEILDGQWLTFDEKAHKKISRSKRFVLLSNHCPV
jgi:predicted nucleic acid-binding protein